MSEESGEEVRKSAVPFGNIGYTPQKYSQFDELGHTGLRIWSGIVSEEFLPQLQGSRFYRAIREMEDNDPTVGALLFMVQMLIRQVEWRMKPAETDNDADKTKAEKYAEHVESCLHDLEDTWPDTIAGIVSFLPYGFNLAEICYKKRGGPDETDVTRQSKFTDGLIGWRKFAYRSQETIWRWEVGEHGDIQAAIQVAPPRYDRVALPMEKCLLFRTTTAKANPQGRSVLRNSFRSWMFKKRLEEIEGIGIERDLAGLPIIYAPERLFEAERNANDDIIRRELEKLVTNIRRDEQEGILMPQSYDEGGHPLYELKLLTTGGRRQFDINASIMRWDLHIALSILADFILLGHENVGSKALSLSKIGVFTTALGAWLDVIASVFNHDAIPRLIKLNGWEARLAPELVHGESTPVEIPELMDAVLKLAQAGAPLFSGSPTDPVMRHMRERLGLPLEYEPYDEELEDAGQQGVLPLQGLPANAPQVPGPPQGAPGPVTQRSGASKPNARGGAAPSAQGAAQRTARNAVRPKLPGRPGT